MAITVTEPIVSNPAVADRLKEVTTLMKTETWYTLNDEEDQHGRVFELMVWKFVKMMGDIEEEDATLSEGHAFGGSGESLKTLYTRLHRLTAHLVGKQDSLAQLDNHCQQGLTPEWDEYLPTLIDVVRTKPFARAKIASQLPSLRKALAELDHGALKEVLDQGERQANAIVALTNAMRHVLADTLLVQYRQLETMKKNVRIGVDLMGLKFELRALAPEAEGLQDTTDEDLQPPQMLAIAGAAQQVLERLQLQQVRELNRCSRNLVRAFAAKAA